MKKGSQCRIAAACAVACLAAFGAFAQNDSPVFDIPYVGKMEVDGLGDHWGGKGFNVNVMVGKTGNYQTPGNFDPRFRLGWNEEGLLVFVTVVDDIREETKDETLLWDRDSMEIFVAKKRGSQELMHIVLTPGQMPEFPGVRSKLLGFRTSAPPKPFTATIVSAPAHDGFAYTVEAMIPWSNLGIDAKHGTEFGFQVFVNDGDKTPARFQAVWYPKTRTHENPDAMHRVRLAAEGSPDINASIRGDYDNFGRFRIGVVTAAPMAGKEVTVTDGQKLLGSGPLLLNNERASRIVYAPLPKIGEKSGVALVHVDGKKAAELPMPSPDDLRTRFLLTAQIVFDPFVFRGTAFPTPDFADPVTAANYLGNYTISTKFYDKDFNLVTAAKEPGRYGAVVEITPENGKPFHRFRTVYRMPAAFEDVSWGFFNSDASVALPPELGIEPAVEESNSWMLDNYMHRLFEDAFTNDPRWAGILAGLADSQAPATPGPFVAGNNAKAVERQWWVDFKRHYYGTDKEFAKPFECPRPIEGPPAPVVKKGSAKQAGMKKDVVKNIDAICTEWAKESKEPFGVCIVRNGVMFFHKAYGEKYGKPMTTETKTWMASISKMLGGTQMMMLVDQGIVDLDAPIDKYLPAFRNIPVETPITTRHLFTHTAGTWMGLTQKGYYPDHWGDEWNDLEELMSEAYPSLKVGKIQAYNGLGYAIAGKIIETVTGEAQPCYAKKHFLDPLGCTHTDIVDMSAYTRSVPMDMAKIGQMLLNKGAYGNQRFFSEETFNKMMPEKQTKLLGPNTDLVWGIGTVWMPEPGLSPKTFAHGAASSATLRIDPENKLVIVMTRNTAGPKYNDYHPKFIKAIVDGMVK
ncbi:MAG TPA: serine hydrolase [Candidatus Hydrogenedentes bacterium]|nr:serine hydrolase [Candidatus Hydrogenedentota bacterium]